ncbi:porin family protein [Fulvivirga lutimaris]|uniref:porin family protein n=1 Tax=Fulvivirga lutimaris TaxID=1819566 RepID=UPI0012BB8270|nr:porin family protein [Fulvivirga lutimaris]MTI41366.1 PorT family protein [Fulvivirga lutimaris]
MRLLITSLLILSISAITHSQVRIGPKAGLTLSQQSFDSDYQVLKSGTEFGAMGNVPLTTQIYLQAELLMTTKGYKEEFGDDIFDQLTSTYLQLPVLLQYRFGNKIEYYGVLGVYAGRWTKGKYRSRIEAETKIIEEDYVFTSSYNNEGFKDSRQEIGAIAGLGLIYPLSINHLILDVRYNYGLTDTYDLETKPEGYKKHANRSIAITLGILFYL